MDALLGTGISGPAAGRMLEGIREINSGFPLASVVAVDIPSGMPSDSGEPAGECARADCTVTFTAPKVAHALPPNCDRVGELIVGAIGSPPHLLCETHLDLLVEPAMFRAAAGAAPARGPQGNLRACAGGGRVARQDRRRRHERAWPPCARARAWSRWHRRKARSRRSPRHAPELMTEPLAETPHGTIALNAELDALAEGKTVIAMGPGLGRDPDIESWWRAAVDQFDAAHGARCRRAGSDGIRGAPDRLRMLTPHPGEMARLTGKTTAEVQKDRLGAARAFAAEHRVTLVLKGQRTVIAFPDGRAWINPTGTPALGTGGSRRRAHRH